MSDRPANIADVTGSGARDIQFHSEIAAVIHAQLTDQDCSPSTREKLASLARRTADIVKQGDPTFSYEWFYGACGLDPWGDLQPQLDPLRPPIVRWDPDLKDFRRI